jgi:hypothetical protein
MAIGRATAPVVAGHFRAACLSLVVAIAVAGCVAAPATGSPTASLSPAGSLAARSSPTGWPVSPSRFSVTGSMVQGRASGTATLLREGRVLITGGFDIPGGVGTASQSLASAELYDSSTGTFSPTGSMTTARSDQTATLLDDGRVLITGGQGSTEGPDGTFNLSSAELYEPATGKFTATGSMMVARYDHTAALLADGRVLIAGDNFAAAKEDRAELYDPATGKFSPTGSMIWPGWYRTATMLADGRVLVAGGGESGTLPAPTPTPTEPASSPMGVVYEPGASAELYDPKTGTFSATGSMTAWRSRGGAVLLPNGRVLLLGGGVASAELYDPATGKFSPTGSMGVSRTSQTATLLSDGRVLVTGGQSTGGSELDSAELYAPTTGLFSPAGLLSQGRDLDTAALLSNGRVLIAGGMASDGTVLATAELYAPNN